MKFNCSRFEHDLVLKIVDRAEQIQEEFAFLNISQDRMTWYMDIVGCHANGCPLFLADLLEAPDSDFVHDVFGIRRHINRKTGALGDGFWPRYAA